MYVYLYICKYIHICIYVYLTIYRHTRVSSFPGLIDVARVNE